MNQVDTAGMVTMMMMTKIEFGLDIHLYVSQMNNTQRTIFGVAYGSYFITVFIDISGRSLGMAALSWCFK